MAFPLRTIKNFRAISLLNGNIDLKVFLPSTPCCQCIRWKRKPLWLGTAKTKIFRIPQRPNIPSEEYGELMRLFKRYKTQMKAIYEVIGENMKEEQALKKQALQFQTSEEEEAEWKECVAINNDWNAEVAILREQRLVRDLEEAEEKALQLKIKKEEEEKRLLADLEIRVKEEKEKSKTYITEANIDEAIEKALDNVVDFNFAIDLQGNFYHGRATKPYRQRREIVEPKAAEATA